LSNVFILHDALFPAERWKRESISGWFTYMRKNIKVSDRSHILGRLLLLFYPQTTEFATSTCAKDLTYCYVKIKYNGT